MDDSRLINIGEVIGEKFLVDKIISSTQYITNCAVKFKDGNQIKHAVLKAERIAPENKQPNNEQIIMQTLSGKKHFTKIIESGTNMNYKYIVHQYLGPSIMDIVMRKYEQKLDLKSLLKFVLKLQGSFI
ncbi:MAG: hypothetical protein EZS28_040224 [Streblomastix strix]|uniref:Protein kinase domain-containing protein n=1 Tax=Streblomastix strix TaxID=222440 RepID=A0A5J4U257_9EUKA|nr:MAG: hypothetical protein EZS28_040224 [Streblomastix strix]